MTKLVNNICIDDEQHSYSCFKKLDDFLRLHGAFPLIKLHGFLTAVSSAPNMILPSQWLALSRIQEIEFESITQATDMMSDIMSLYNKITTSLRKRTYKPFLYVPDELKTNGTLHEEIIENTKLWATGYWIGVEMTWPFEENMKLNPEINSPLGMIHYLTLSKQEFIKEHSALHLVEEDDDYYQLFMDFLPNAAIEICNINDITRC